MYGRVWNLLLPLRSVEANRIVDCAWQRHKRIVARTFCSSPDCPGGRDVLAPRHTAQTGNETGAHSTFHGFDMSSAGFGLHPARADIDCSILRRPPAN